MWLACTMGDPAGIGPEILLKSLARLPSSVWSKFLILGDLDHLKWVQETVCKNHPAKQLDLQPRLSMSQPKKGVVLVESVPPSLPRKIRYGKPNSFYGWCSGLYIQSALKLIRNKKASALITSPINKESFQKGGWGKKYIGHAEMLAAETNSKTVLHMMMKNHFRVIHVTSHIPLKNVAKTLTKKKVIEAIVLADKALKKLGIRKPNILVNGLNPHAGDNGLLGTEEKKIIKPALIICKKKNIHVRGPISPDISPLKVWAGEADIFVALYHDQGQIPLKLISSTVQPNKKIIMGGVLMSLGLPFYRLSPCHGTAYDIAGKGVASEESMREALTMGLSLEERH